MPTTPTYFVVKPKLRGLMWLKLLILICFPILMYFLYVEGSFLYLFAGLLGVVLLIVLTFKTMNLSLNTYKITGSYVEKSRHFFTDTQNKVPIDKIQSYEVRSDLLDKLAGTATVVLKTGSDSPTLIMNGVGKEYVDGIENTIELIIKKDIERVEMDTTFSAIRK
jgi:uncharacterized membrane protein YdbT with pleckstrin-like domain